MQRFIELIVKGMSMDMGNEYSESAAMAKARETARGYFREGLNCAECILRAFMDDNETKLPDGIIRLASGFGGGIGGSKSLCGAVSGAVLALGTSKGRDPFAMSTPKERIVQLHGDVYPSFQALAQELETRYGTLICRELSAPQGDFEGRERKKNCQEIIGTCAALAVKYAEA